MSKLFLAPLFLLFSVPALADSTTFVCSQISDSNQAWDYKLNCDASVSPGRGTIQVHAQGQGLDSRFTLDRHCSVDKDGNVQFTGDFYDNHGVGTIPMNLVEIIHTDSLAPGRGWARYFQMKFQGLTSNKAGADAADCL